MLLPSQKFITLTLNLFKLASQGVRYALIALNILPKLSLHLGLYLRRRGRGWFRLRPIELGSLPFLLSHSPHLLR